MKTTVQVQRRAARAMKRAVQHGVDPRNTAPTFAKVYKRMWTDDMRRKPIVTPMGIDAYGRELHVHKFDWDGDQQCECGAKFF